MICIYIFLLLFHLKIYIHLKFFNKHAIYQHITFNIFSTLPEIFPAFPLTLIRKDYMLCRLIHKCNIVYILEYIEYIECIILVHVKIY